MKMQKYSEWAPTSFDCRGLSLHDRQDWIVCPVIQTRDSEPFESSNYASAVALLDGANAEYEEHRFGHWGPGWFDIILVNPAHAKVVEDIENRLENYPLLDEEDLSRREWDLAVETWGNMSLRERVALSERFGFHLMACRRDEVPQDRNGSLLEYLVSP
jgi:hypothetical protein